MRVPGAPVAEVPPSPVPAALAARSDRKSNKPVIVAGDFNTFWGTHEIYLFMRAAGLRSANTLGLPSFPARVPRSSWTSFW